VCFEKGKEKFILKSKEEELCRKQTSFTLLKILTRSLNDLVRQSSRLSSIFFKSSSLFSSFLLTDLNIGRLNGSSGTFFISLTILLSAFF
jgi:hypothetical protein